jgi:hypothetical protein
MTINGSPTPIKIKRNEAYICTLDGGTGVVQELRNGSWRNAIDLVDGVTSDPTFFQTEYGDIQVIGTAGEFEFQEVNL